MLCTSKTGDERARVVNVSLSTSAVCKTMACVAHGNDKDIECALRARTREGERLRQCGVQRTREREREREKRKLVNELQKDQRLRR